MTAVEWLIDYIKNLETYPYKTFQELNQQALEMEKEQIAKAYDSGGDHYTDSGAPIWGVDYYNETYGK
jgi:hypothetical protein